MAAAASGRAPGLAQAAPAAAATVTARPHGADSERQCQCRGPRAREATVQRPCAARASSPVTPVLGRVTVTEPRRARPGTQPEWHSASDCVARRGRCQPEPAA